MKCPLCNSIVDPVDHPGIGKLIHHGGMGCRNTGAHSEAGWSILCGEPVDNVAASMSAQEIAADPEIVQPQVLEPVVFNLTTPKKGK